MKVRVTRMWEAGKAVPRWQWPRLQSIEGDLYLDDMKDFDFRRSLRKARLVASGGEPIPELLDAAVTRIAGRTMTISGLEHDRAGIAPTVAQSWFVELLGGGETGPPALEDQQL